MSRPGSPPVRPVRPVTCRLPARAAAQPQPGRDLDHREVAPRPRVRHRLADGQDRLRVRLHLDRRPGALVGHPPTRAVRLARARGQDTGLRGADDGRRLDGVFCSGGADQVPRGHGAGQ
eukprot:3843445-Prymnesium_polylepis.1